LKTIMLLSIVSISHGEETCTFGRLFVSDGQSPKVVVIDLDSGSEVYSMPDSATTGAVNTPDIYPSSDAQHMYINYGSAQGVVRIIKIGIELESHGDHADVLKATPTLLTLNITGDMPTHFTTGNQKTVIFFDGRKESNSSVFGFVDTDLSGKGMTKQFNYGPMDPQHGIAVPLANDYFIVSQPNPGYKTGASDSMSVGFIVVDKDGKTVYSMNEAGNLDKSCPGYHGHARYGSNDVFGCSGGFLSLTHDPSTNTFTSRQVKHHDTGSGRKTGTFFEHERQPIIIGQHAGGTPAQFSFIRWTAGSPSYAAPSDVLDFGAVRPCASGFELALGKAFATLLTNGSLMVFDVASGWALRNSVVATDSFTCTGSSHPRMAMGYHRVFLLFPATKEVVEYRLSLSTLAKGRTLKTTVEPAAGVVAGLSPAVSAVSACPDGVVLEAAEKAATAVAKNTTASTSSTRSPAGRVPSGGGARLLLSACMAGGLASLRAVHGGPL
jgi:hypothetical protein